jgi:LPS export ABC transporter protein LptC
MKNFKRFLGIIILCSLVVVAVIVWRTVSVPNSKTAPQKAPSTTADLKLDRVRYTETREGVKEWELEAESALYYKEDNTVVFDKVKATFFGKNQESYTLVADKGKLNTQTKEIEVFSQVKIDSSNGYHMRTETLKYLVDKKELSTADRVEMNGPQLHVLGTGLVVELEQQRVKVLHEVTTTLTRLSRKNMFRSAS